MSNKFARSSVYMIIDDSEITTQMINYSKSTSRENMPSKTSGGVLKRVVEVAEPADSVFSAYTWYSNETVITAWEALP